MEIRDLRREYQSRELRRKNLKDDPFEQFSAWWDEVIHEQILEPNAMALATGSKDGKPSCRMVLMKQFDKRGIVFFTNLESRKAKEIKGIPFAALTFFWREMERQIHIEGSVEKITREEDFSYFSSRPRRSQISAWASPQDQVISSREQLENLYHFNETRFQNEQQLPLPSNWGGFRLKPYCFEFWQGRRDRLHDRFNYSLKESGTWKIERLAP